MNLYEKIQTSLSNKQVARFYLGEPKQYSGSSIGYCSPFRNEKHPSFWVNDDKGFTDFAAKEYSGNMITFVKQYKNLPTYFDAAKQIITDFNLDIELNDNMSCYRKNRLKEKVTNVAFDKEGKPEKILCMFDTMEHTSKPESKEAAFIKNRIPNLQMRTYTLDELLDNIVKGKTIIPAGIKSNAKANFKGQQVFLVDFDNTKNGEKILATDNEHVTVERLLDYCNKINLMPTFVYYTFSHSDVQHKFRIGYVFKDVINEYKIAEKIPKELLKIFKDFNPDTSKQNLADFFYGGKGIAYRADNYYNPRLLEGYTYIDEFEISEDKYKEYNDLLMPYGYHFSQRGLTRKISRQDGIEDKVISNFIATPMKYVTYDNGKDSRTEVELKAILNTGEELNSITVDVNNIESINWVTNDIWKLKTRISPNGNNKEYFRDAVKILEELAKVETRYSHMGFRKINGKMYYLYHNGVIGEDHSIKVDLSEYGLEQYQFSDEDLTETEINTCIDTSCSIISLGNETITIPMLAAIYLAPLQHIFNELNISNGCVVWILGESGTQKSTIAALLLSHFGKFERDTIPCGFKDTVNSLEKEAFIIKDSALLVDDYYPSQSLQEARKMDAVAESIFGMAGDKQGRARMKQNGKDIRKSCSARGIIMATGENFPNFAESRVARSIIIEIEKGDINLDILSVLQSNKDKLNISMREYIKWIINNYDKIKKKINDNFYKYRDEFSKELSHARIPENITSLYIGIECFIDFMHDRGVISEEGATDTKRMSKVALLKLGFKQSLRIQDFKPDKMFFHAIQEMLASKEVYFTNYLNEEHSMELHNAKLIGCYHREEEVYYLIAGHAYNAVVEFYEKQNIKFPLNQKSLYAYLRKHGSIKIAEKDRNTVRRKINNEYVSVVAIRQELISEGLGNIEPRKNEELILPF